MEVQPSAEKPTRKRQAASKNTNQGTLKKIDQDTAKIITQIRDKANKKHYGRKVRDAEVLAMAVSLITDKEVSLLQEATYSEQDRLHMAHAEYIANNKRITLDDFIGKLLRGEISQKSN